MLNQSFEGMSPCTDLVTAFCDHLRVRGHSPRTIHHRLAVLTKADRELPAGLCATSQEIQPWLYRDDLSANTRAAYYSALNSFYTHWAGRPGGLACNPMTDLPRPQSKPGRPRPVSRQQLEKILTAAADPYRLWALLAAGLGARCIEISRLDRDDVTEEHTYLHGKGDKHRTVPTHPAVYERVRVLPAGPVARTQQGFRATPHYISSLASIYFRDQLDMPGVTMHTLRHHFATLVQRAAGDIRVTQELLGHSKPETTARYTEVDYEQKRAAVDALRLPARDAAGRSLRLVSPGDGERAATGNAA